MRNQVHQPGMECESRRDFGALELVMNLFLINRYRQFLKNYT